MHKGDYQYRLKGFRFLYLVVFAFFVSPSFVFAQSANPPAPRPDRASQADPLDAALNEQVDVVLLLDASASMRVTDPERLRVEGAKLLTQFLKDGDRLGIIEFDGEARTLRELSRYHPMQAPEVHLAIEDQSDAGLYTDFVAGLLEAKKMFERSSSEGVHRVVVLFSDGHLDPDPRWSTAEGAKDGLLYRLMPELKQLGIVLHTLAFSKEADRSLLAQMAQTTEGMNWFAETPEKIHETFAELFLVIKKPQIVPLIGKGFRIDGEVEEATFYINTASQVEGELSLKSPSGNIYGERNLAPGMKWFAGPQFHTITVDNPEVGLWQFLGLPEHVGFATVLTNLKLITDWPSSLLAGNKRTLRARLYDDDKPVVLPEMTGITTYAFQITPTDRVSEPIIREVLLDDGAPPDSSAQDGVFSASVELETPGEYQLKILAKGPTFERQQAIPFRVKPRLINLTVVAVEQLPDVALGQTVGTSTDYFRVTLNPEVANLKNIDIKLVAIDSKRRLYELPIKKRSDGSLRYEVPSSELIEVGEYELQATIKGETRKGKVKGTSQVLIYERRKLDIDHAPKVERVVVKEEPVDETPPFLLFSVIIFLANAATAAFCAAKVRKNAGPREDTIPKFEISQGILDSIASLESLAVASEVDFEDPRYGESDDDVLPVSTLGLAGGRGEAPSEDEEEEPLKSEEEEEQEQEEEED